MTVEVGADWPQGAPLAVLLAVLLFILFKLIPILEVVVISMLLAFTFRSLMYWLSKLHIPHKLGAVIVLLGMAAIVVGIWMLVAPRLPDWDIP